MKRTQKLNGGVWAVVGIIDAYGALHYRKCKLGDEIAHEHYWPNQTHKRWRFDVSDWDLEVSVLSAKLDEAEADAVLAEMEKVLIPPEWFARGKAWDEAGRPHGKKGDAFDRKWERTKPAIYRQ